MEQIYLIYAGIGVLALRLLRVTGSTIMSTSKLKKKDDMIGYLHQELEDKDEQIKTQNKQINTLLKDCNELKRELLHATSALQESIHPDSGVNTYTKKGRPEQYGLQTREDNLAMHNKHMPLKKSLPLK